MERGRDPGGNTIYIDDDGDTVFPACVGCENYETAASYGGPCEDERPCQAYPRKRRERR